MSQKEKRLCYDQSPDDDGHDGCRRLAVQRRIERPDALFLSGPCRAVVRDPMICDGFTTSGGMTVGSPNERLPSYAQYRNDRKEIEPGRHEMVQVINPDILISQLAFLMPKTMGLGVRRPRASCIRSRLPLLAPNLFRASSGSFGCHGNRGRFHKRG